MLSIKTAHDSGHRFGDSELLCFNDVFAIFKCKCGKEFQKRKYKPYNKSMEDMMCTSCRTKSRVGEYQTERQIFRRVKDDAKARGLSFDLSIEWFALAIHMPCHYCSSVDKNSSLVILTDDNGVSKKVSYRYNGIDRMDNSIGYVEDNCLPCCFVCNRAKRDMDYFEFEEHLISIARQWRNRA